MPCGAWIAPAHAPGGSRARSGQDHAGEPRSHPVSIRRQPRSMTDACNDAVPFAADSRFRSSRRVAVANVAATNRWRRGAGAHVQSFPGDQGPGLAIREFTRARQDTTGDLPRRPASSRPDSARSCIGSRPFGCKTVGLSRARPPCRSDIELHPCQARAEIAGASGAAERSQGGVLVKPMTDEHFAVVRRQMVEVIAIYTELASEELGKTALDPRVMAAMASVPRHRFVPEPLAAVAYHEKPCRSASTRRSPSRSSLR